MNVGDLVVPIDRDYPLHCATSIYPYAFVASLEPFALISGSGDMVWRCRDMSEFRVPTDHPSAGGMSMEQVERRGLS